MTNNLLIVGAGGNGKVVAEIAKAMNVWDKISFIDDNKLLFNNPVLGCEVVGTINEIGKYTQTYKNIIVTIGDNVSREAIINKVKNLGGCQMVSVIHPSAIISGSAKVGKGCMIMPNVVINAQAILGDGVIVNTSAIIEHDVNVGDFVHISPASVVAGNAKVNKNVWIGMGACIKQGITIGENSIVGAGAVVINNMPSAVKVAGVPARIIEE